MGAALTTLSLAKLAGHAQRGPPRALTLLHSYCTQLYALRLSLPSGIVSCCGCGWLTVVPWPLTHTHTCVVLAVFVVRTAEFRSRVFSREIA